MNKYNEQMRAQNLILQNWDMMEVVCILIISWINYGTTEYSNDPNILIIQFVQFIFWTNWKVSKFYFGQWRVPWFIKIKATTNTHILSSLANAWNAQGQRNVYNCPNLTTLSLYHVKYRCVVPVSKRSWMLHVRPRGTWPTLPLSI